MSLGVRVSRGVSLETTVSLEMGEATGFLERTVTTVTADTAETAETAETRGALSLGLPPGPSPIPHARPTPYVDPC